MYGIKEKGINFSDIFVLPKIIVKKKLIEYRILGEYIFSKKKPMRVGIEVLMGVLTKNMNLNFKGNFGKIISIQFENNSIQEIKAGMRAAVEIDLRLNPEWIDKIYSMET